MVELINKEPTTCCKPKEHLPSCCQPKKKNSLFEEFMNTAEKVSAIVIGVFALLTTFKLFVPFFFIGVALGVHKYMNTTPTKEKGHIASLCSQGFLEQVTGIRLPAPVSLAANVAMLVGHLDHHPEVYGPIVGLTTGIWLGKFLAPTVQWTLNKLNTTESLPPNNLKAGVLLV